MSPDREPPQGPGRGRGEGRRGEGGGRQGGGRQGGGATPGERGGGREDRERPDPPKAPDEEPITPEGDDPTDVADEIAQDPAAPGDDRDRGGAGDPPQEDDPVAEVDFTDEPAAPGPTALELTDYNPEPEREKMRGRLASTLVYLLVVIILAGPAAVLLEASVQDMLSLYEVLLPPVVALTGTVVGFYFAGGTIKK